MVLQAGAIWDGLLGNNKCFSLAFKALLTLSLPHQLSELRHSGHIRPLTLPQTLCDATSCCFLYLNDLISFSTFGEHILQCLPKKLPPGNPLAIQWLESMLALLRAQVQSLVGELRFHRLRGLAKKKKKELQPFPNFLLCVISSCLS